MEALNEKREVYLLIRGAQELEAEGKGRQAFGQYIEGIHSLTRYLLREKQDWTSSRDFEDEVRVGVKTLKQCAERLEEILEESASQTVSQDIQRNGTEPKEVSFDPRDPRKPRDMSSFESCPSITKKTVNGERPDLCHKRPLSFQRASGSIAIYSPSPIIEKVNQENAVLNRIFQNRINNCKDLKLRANLELELQRRLTENATLAKRKEAQRYQEKQAKERKALEDAAKKLLVATKEGKIDINTSVASDESQFNKQYIYAQILQYEEEHPRVCVKGEAFGYNTATDTAEELLAKDRHHPLNQWMTMIQFNVMERVQPLIQEYEKRLVECEAQDFLVNLDGSDFALRSICELKLINKLEEDALERHLNTIVSYLNTAHETLVQMVTLVVLSGVEESGHSSISTRDWITKQSYCLESAIADYLYSPLWVTLSKLFRIVYAENERLFSQGMKDMLMNRDSRELQAELSAGSEDGSTVSQMVLEEAATQLKSVLFIANPYEKLKIFVRFMETLCSKIKSGEKEMGADQLIPVLVLVVIKTSCPRLLSECEAIEQLVNSKQLMGQEGYCLSSVQTALKYVEMNGNGY